jgi:hypothetical protein
MTLSLSQLREALGGYKPRARKENDFAGMHKIQTTDPLNAPQSKTAPTGSGDAEKTKDGKYPGERGIIDQGASKVDFHFPMIDQISPLPQDRDRNGDLKAFGAASRVKGIQEGVESNRYVVIVDKGNRGFPQVKFFSSDTSAASFADSMSHPGAPYSEAVYLCKVLSVK